MELLILRHGIAEDSAPTGRDEDRRLTGEGRDKLRVTLRQAHRAGVRPSLIVSSPLVRAVQSAEIASEECEYAGEIVQSSALTPDADPHKLWEEVRSMRGEEQLLLASHNPLCSRLPGFLLGAPGLQIDFRKGALLRIDFSHFGSEPRGVLQWLLTAKLAQP